MSRMCFSLVGCNECRVQRNWQPREVAWIENLESSIQNSDITLPTQQNKSLSLQIIRTPHVHPCLSPSPNRPASQSSAKRPRQRGNKAKQATQDFNLTIITSPHSGQNARPVKDFPLPRRIRLDRRLTIHSKHLQRKLGEGSTLRFQRVRR